VPVFVSRLSEQKKKEALGTAYLAAFVFVMISLVVSVSILAGNSFTLMELISGGSNIDKNLSFTLIKVLIPIMYIIPVAYICIAYLNAQDKFIATTAAPLLYNAFILITVVGCVIFDVPSDHGILLISWAISLAALLMTVYLFFVAGAFRRKPHLRSCLAACFTNTRNLRKLGNQALCFLLIYSLYQSVLFFERFTANRIGPGGISALNYAYRLAQFPLWVFISALLVVILPEFSRNIAIQNHRELYNKLHNAWLILFLFITPVAILLFYFRSEVLSLIFLRGAFGHESLILTSQIIAGYSLSIVFQSLSYLLLRVYLVNEKMEKVLLSYLISSAVNIAFDLACYQQLGLWTIGIGAMLGWFVNLLLLFGLGERVMRQKLLTEEPLTPLIIIGANIIAIILTGLSKRFLVVQLEIPWNTLGTIIILVVSGLIYLFVYVIILYKFKIIQRILRY
jgi:murein biosynthesis integral membrane protein MurJ